MGRTIQRLLCVGISISAVSCYATGGAVDPPNDTMYFPSALEVSPDGSALYVANSDFDLQYNGGNLQVYDLPRLRLLVNDWAICPDHPEGACGGGRRNDWTSLIPGVCPAFDPARPPLPRPDLCHGNGNMGAAAQPSTASLVVGVHPLGAFATQVKFVVFADEAAGGGSSNAGGHLLVPVRGDPSLTVFDVGVSEGNGEGAQKIGCGVVVDGRCDENHRLGLDANDNVRQLTLPAEPFDVAYDGPTKTAIITHQLFGDQHGMVSLFADSAVLADPTRTLPRQRAASGSQGRLSLQFILDQMPDGVTGIATVPRPKYLQCDASYQPGFLVGSRSAPELEVLRFIADRAVPPRPFLSRVSSFPIPTSPGAFDSRDVAIDDFERAACEGSCVVPEGADACDVQAAPERADEVASYRECLRACIDVPLRVFAVNRAPSSLLVGEIVTRGQAESQGDDSVRIYDAVPVALGASKVVLGSIKNRQGVPERRVFVVCFDSKMIYVYDPANRRVETIIPTGNGPHSLVMDPRAPLAYVGHFTDSYLGVLDLDESHPTTFETIVASMGIPSPPAESK